MKHYSATSQENLNSCHVDLQRIFTEALQVMDHSIICGHRTEKEQLALYLEGKTQLRSGGEHNCVPSKAVDAIPYPVDWTDTERMCMFAGIVLAKADSLGVAIRWGGDWDGDTELKDNVFDDLVHFELVGKTV